MIKYKKLHQRYIYPLIVFFALCNPLYADDAPSNTISWKYLIIGLFGGLALFLYGMEKMSEGMKKSAGNKMRTFLAALTRNRIMGFLVGAFVTMVIQSSSATTVMLVSFAQAELMSFVQALGIILGADIGTTITAQLIAFKLTDYALLMVAIGFSMRMFARQDKIKESGEVILGFGILFFGMKLMSDSMKPLQTYPHFLQWMQGLENPLTGIMVGTFFTALIQSSSAFTGIVIVLGQQELISLEAAIPLIFGANIGTCITAALASIGTSRDAKRVALAHVLFKLAGVILFIAWIPAFAEIIRAIAVRFDSDISRQIANAHTLFSITMGLIFLPFTALFARFILNILPDKMPEKKIRPFTSYLDESKIVSPALAIDLARSEISRMAKLLGRMLNAIIVPFTTDEKRRDVSHPQLTLLEGIELREQKINFLEERISNYLLQIVKQGTSEQQASEIYAMLSIIKDMESIGDIIHRNMIPIIDKKRALKTDFSPQGKEELLIYHEKVCKQIHLLEEAFNEKDLEKAREIMASERTFLDLELQYRIHHLDRFLHEQKGSVETHSVHLELMNLMKQIAVYSSNIAKTFHESSQF